MRLENQPASDEKTGIDRATVFGDVPVSTMKAEWTPETMRDYFQLMTGTIRQALSSGMDGYVTKPIAMEALFDEIAAVIGRNADLAATSR